MKKFRLFVAAALAAMCGQQAMALDIDEPVLDGSKLTPLVIEDVADVDTVYLYHVGQNMFLTEGNAYGTQTSLGNAGNKIVIQREGVDGYKLYDYSPGKAAWKYIFVADANGSYVDMASQGHNVFTFYKLDNGNYEFSILRTDATYGVESSFGETRFGWDGVEGSTIIMPLLDLASADAEFFQYEWKIVSVKDAALAVYQAKTDLFNTLNKAVDQGVADDQLNSYAALLLDDNPQRPSSLPCRPWRSSSTSRSSAATCPSTSPHSWRMPLVQKADSRDGTSTTPAHSSTTHGLQRPTSLAW